jgi:predicted PurR-regulated permease PerM
MGDARSSRLSAKRLTIALSVIVAVLLLPYVSGLMGAMILYVVGAPVTRRIAAGRRRRGVAFVTVFVMFFAIVLPTVLLLAQLVAQIPDTLQSFEQSRGMQRLATSNIGSINLGAQLDRARDDIVAWSSRQTISAVGGMIGATLNLIIALFGAYYLMVSGERLWRWFKGVLPFSPITSELLRVRFHRVTEAMLIGVVLTGVAQGTLVGVALALAGFSHAILWGAVTAVASLLPIFGSGLVWGPAVLVLFAQGRASAALAIALFGLIVVSNIDNALRLVVYRRVSHVHPMVTLVGAFAGVRAFGLSGLLLGPLVLSYAIELLRVYDKADDVGGATSADTTRQGLPVDAPVTAPTPIAIARL